MSEKENEAEALCDWLENYGEVGRASSDLNRNCKSAASLLRSQAERIAELEKALEDAESFIMGAVPQYARDRDEAVKEVLPAIRTALRGEKEKATPPQPDPGAIQPATPAT